MSFLVRAACFGALILAFAGFAPVAAAKTILIFGPHPDDEALIAAGTVSAAVAAGHTVRIVVVTNGDFNDGVARGLARQADSVRAAEVLGLREDDVIFLGYPDGGLLQIYEAASSTPITSNAGQTHTYGTRGRDRVDYHSARFGSPGPYTRATMEQDFRTLIAELRPDEIYTVSHFDTHSDHWVTAIYVTEALAALKRADPTLPTKLLQGIVWVPSHQTPPWPEAGGCVPNTPFPAPQMQTQLEWKRTLRATVLANLKCQAIDAYHMTVNTWLRSFARKDEFFWLNDFGANLAMTAQVTASSESTAQGRMRAVDGFVDGEIANRPPAIAMREWVSSNQLAGAWIQLDWSAPVSVAQVNLYDRPQAGENVLAGTLSFSDGTSIAVGALPADGKLLPVTFAPKTLTWVRFTINQAQGTAAGLSEIQVLGVAARSRRRTWRRISSRARAATATRASSASETASFSVSAHDLNGDALQYEWSADGGTIEGSGASVVFRPPARDREHALHHHRAHPRRPRRSREQRRLHHGRAGRRRGHGEPHVRARRRRRARYGQAREPRAHGRLVGAAFQQPPRRGPGPRERHGPGRGGDYELPGHHVERRREGRRDALGEHQGHRPHGRAGRNAAAEPRAARQPARLPGRDRRRELAQRGTHPPDAQLRGRAGWHAEREPRRNHGVWRPCAGAGCHRRREHVVHPLLLCAEQWRQRRGLQRARQYAWRRHHPGHALHFGHQRLELDPGERHVHHPGRHHLDQRLSGARLGPPGGRPPLARDARARGRYESAGPRGARGEPGERDGRRHCHGYGDAERGGSGGRRAGHAFEQ